jgi:hypothetical protein
MRADMILQVKQAELSPKSEMRVEKREFAWEFPQLTWSGQTRTRVAWELMRADMILQVKQAELSPKSEMRVEKREFAWEFPQLTWSGQTRTRVAWELTGYYHAHGENSHQNLNQLKVDESARGLARSSRIFRLNTRTSGNQGRVHRGLRWEFSLPARYNIQFTLISCTLILVWPGHHGPAWVEKTHMQFLARPPHTRETCRANRLEWRLAQLCIFTAHVGKTSQQQHCVQSHMKKLWFLIG